MKNENKKISIISIRKKADECKGKSLSEILPEEIIRDVKLNDKGNIGKLTESYLTNKPVSNKPIPDFENLGIELKTIGFKKIRNKEEGEILVPKERLVLSNINYIDIVKEGSFVDSKLFKKINKIFFMVYLYENDKLFYQWKFIKNTFVDFSKNRQFIKKLDRDFQTIKSKIFEGLAHEISEADTQYLKATTRGANNIPIRMQPFSNHLAKTRAFSFNIKTLNYILNNFNNIEFDFFGYFNEIFKPYLNKSIKEICNILNVDFLKLRNNKNIKFQMIQMIANIIRYKDLPEYQNSFVKIKNIEINDQFKLSEQIGILDLNIDEVFSKTFFDDSELFNFLTNYYYIFVVWKKEEKIEDTILKDIVKYEFSQELIKDAEYVYNDTINKCWTQSIKSIEYSKNTKNKFKRNMLFIKCKDEKSFHIRPHGRDGLDTIELPSKEKITRQQFWLNNSNITNFLKNK